MCCVSIRTLSISDVRYQVGDRLGELLALFSLLPIFIVAQLVALLFVRRDWQTLVVLVGIFINVIINKVIKDTLQYPRPIMNSGCSGDEDSSRASIAMFEEGSYEEFGMPSNHSQFIGYVACFVILFLTFKVKASKFEKVLLSLISILFAGTVAYSRTYLGYHTSDQVIIGLLIGIIFGIVWYVLYIYYFEGLGKRIVKTRWAKLLLIRETSSVSNVALFEYQQYMLSTSMKKISPE